MRFLVKIKDALLNKSAFLISSHKKKLSYFWLNIYKIPVGHCPLNLESCVFELKEKLCNPFLVSHPPNISASSKTFCSSWKRILALCFAKETFYRAKIYQQNCFYNLQKKIAKWIISQKKFFKKGTVKNLFCHQQKDRTGLLIEWWYLISKSLISSQKKF